MAGAYESEASLPPTCGCHCCHAEGLVGAVSRMIGELPVVSEVVVCRDSGRAVERGRCSTNRLEVWRMHRVDSRVASTAVFADSFCWLTRGEAHDAVRVRFRSTIVAILGGLAVVTNDRRVLQAVHCSRAATGRA